LTDERNVAAISEALAKVVGGSWQIVIAAGPGGPTGSATQPDAPGEQPAAQADVDPRDDADYEPAAPTATPPVDQELAATKLLRDELGARRLD
jgi:hypothetical protein